MLYPMNADKELSTNLFSNPTAEYRGAPFWAWNCKLEQEELIHQIDIFRGMGMGGFHIHSRVGMATPYLSDSFMQLVSACNDKAKANGMLCWLYDEDKWPSGFAGGLVTKDYSTRARHLLFSPELQQNYCVSENDFKQLVASGQKPKGYFIAAYQVELQEGQLVEWQRFSLSDIPAHKDADLWYAYLEIEEEGAWFNGQAYVDTLNVAAIDSFIDITHKFYEKYFGQDFGASIPAIFTDEPQFARKQCLKTPYSREAVHLPWTDRLPDKFCKKYGMDLLEHLPELIWQRKDNEVSVARYQYHDLVCEMFVSAFCDNVGQFCHEHNLLLTGHVMDEDNLGSQTRSVGEAMRCYRGFGLPGVDVLVNQRELTAVKQAQSAARQMGAPGVLSEIYGVTGYEFDFRGHKLAGDWQAALGVTTRAHHLSLVSMQGEAKRDYPASINYQMPWYSKYAIIEDHFARVNTALTRGKPLVRVGVIHPIESYWLHWGPMLQTAGIREDMERKFEQLARWLLFGHIDFDYISESLLCKWSSDEGEGFTVGEMHYDIVLLAGCETIRSTTLALLRSFIERGGQVIVMGAVPVLLDARPSKEPCKVLAGAHFIPESRQRLMDALKSTRSVEILDCKTGTTAENLIYQLRRDGDCQWFFCAHVDEEPDYPFEAQLYGTYPDRSHQLNFVFEGSWNLQLYDTLTGAVQEQASCVQNGQTEWQVQVYPYDSLLVKLVPYGTVSQSDTTCVKQYCNEQLLPNEVAYELSEPNVLLLDMAEYSYDGESWLQQEEMLRLDSQVARHFGILNKSDMPQPWVYMDEDQDAHWVWLRFSIDSEVDMDNVSIALERIGAAEIYFNGKPVNSVANGWYIDKAIKRIDGLILRVGENQLVVKYRYSRDFYLENAFLLGDFGVDVRGSKCRVVSPPKTLCFGDVTAQGLPFYGGNIIYKCAFQACGKGMAVEIPNYVGALLSVALDGNHLGDITSDPYRLDLGKPAPGMHLLEITLYGNRYNTMGALHNTFKNIKWYGPLTWRSQGYGWSYEYNLKKTGIMSTPKLLCAD